MNEKAAANSQGRWHNFFSGLYLVLVGLVISYFNSSHKLTKDIPPFDVFLMFLATFRLIRLFVYDSVTSHIREYLEKFPTGAGKELSMLINCPWCTGVWMAFVVFFLYFANPLLWYFLLILAMAGVGTYLQIIIWKIGLEPEDWGVKHKE